MDIALYIVFFFVTVSYKFLYPHIFGVNVVGPLQGVQD
jgi:hypothetical protein